MNAIVSSFNRSSYTLEELSNTGIISQFSNEEKLAIVKLKNLQQKYDFLEKEVMDICISSYQLLAKESDTLYEEKFTTKEHKEIRGWRFDIDSRQYRLLNNHISDVLGLYEFQDIEMYPLLRRSTLDLLNLLKQK